MTGIFGDPVAHSWSSYMHNAAFAELGLDMVYVPWRVRAEDLENAVEAIRSLNLVGVNVTIPHKVAVLPYLDEVTPQARLIGAVNTIHNQDGRLVGYNTDGAGFLESLRREAGVDPKGATVMLAGAGGAARAVAMALAAVGARRIVFANRTLERARDLAGAVAVAVPSCEAHAIVLDEAVLRQRLAGVDIFINASPVGMHPAVDQPPVVEPALFPPGILVCDLVYNPLETRLLRESRERDLKILTGDGMLLYQGVLAFEIWTGRQAPVDIMRAALKDALG
ncbi:MAG: shikimate dehydrogenase [Firmicutes bacterium]|nr:shikimate dehydrogenase [Bacillota bacterium]